MNDGSQPTPTEAAEQRLSGALGEVLRGREIGRYIVLNKLGAGGMGVVVAAYDPELDRKVAIKLLHARNQASEAERRRLLAEAQALARLSDPNVVAVYDVGTHEGHVFVAMEFIDGQTLKQWLTAEPRAWARVLDVMLSAGRGLAAAHARGLAHRDFKPGNVMLGDDGRVRVMDFGLALAQEGSSSVDEPEDERVQPRERALGQALTQTGKLIGTPAYMAPEQLSERGGPAADQFSFCVSLWEGLYGERPFSGQTLQELFARVLAGRIDEPPKTARVPRWLRRVVEKGLAVDPQRRWASMSELLGALERGKARGWWRAVLALGFAGAAGVGLLLATDDRARCSGARGKLQGIWDGETRAAMAESFGATGMPYAEDARRSTEESLDGYSERWVELRTEICEATRVRGEQSEALMDVRIGCLDGKLRDAAALTAVLANADVDVVKNAAQAAQALPSLDECVTLERDAAGLVSPADPALAMEVEEIRTQIAKARAFGVAGKYSDGVAVASPALVAARRTGYKPVIAEAGVILGDVSEKSFAVGPAREAYEEALYAAAASGHARIEAVALMGLLSLWGMHLSDTDRALGYGRHGEAVLGRLGNPPELEATLALYRGNTLMSASRFEAAIVELQRAIERSEGVPGAERIHLAALSNLAAVQGQQGHYREAIQAFERSLALSEERLGPWHPIVATNYLNLGVTQARLEEHDAAIENNRRALDIYLKSLGPEHGEVGRAYHNLGFIQNAKGDVEAAYESYLEALEIKQRALGPDHVSVAFSANNVGDALVRLGRPREAIPYCEDALRIWTKAQGEASPASIYSLVTLGEAHLALDEPQKAETRIRRALALAEVGEIDPIEVTRARFVAARAIWNAGGDRDEAIALAEQAKQDYEDSERPSTKELAAITSWLAERR